jgi:hypothetical protein
VLDGFVIDDTELFNNKLQDGRTSTTSTDRTAVSVDRPPTNDYDKRPRPRRKRPLSVAHLAVVADVT